MKQFTCTVLGFALTLTLCSCGAPTTAAKDQAFRSRLAGTYQAECMAFGGPLYNKTVLNMPYADDFSEFNIILNLYLSDTCSGDSVAILEVPARTTFGAVVSETDQNFTSQILYNSDMVTSQKMNLTYGGTFITILSSDFLTSVGGSFLGVTRANVKTDVSGATPSFPSVGEKAYGVLYMPTTTSFVTNVNLSARITDPNLRANTALILDTVFTKQ